MIKVSGEVNMIPTLRKIRGGGSPSYFFFWWGGSLETLLGGAQLKKHPVYQFGKIHVKL